jgi:hypothetical protein
MISISDKVKQSILYISLFVIFVYIIKPSVIFKQDGNLREYGVGVSSDGYKKTLYTMHFFIIVFAIGLYKYL